MTANANVLTASNSPVTRSAPEPMSAATPATKTAATQDRQRERHRFEADVEEPVDLEPAGERGAGERADAGECHLAERQLPRPPREHRQRQRADGEGGDRRVHDMLGGFVNTNGARIARPSSVSMVIRSRCRTQKIERSRSGMTSTRGLNENTASPPRSRGNDATETSTTTSSSRSTRPGLARKLNLMTPSTSPIDDARGEGDLERDESSDQRSGECPQE